MTIRQRELEGYSPREHRIALDKVRADLGLVDPCEAECPRCGQEHHPDERCRESAEERDDRRTHERFDREASE
jgi:hypothetical protein